MFNHLILVCIVSAFLPSCLASPIVKEDNLIKGREDALVYGTFDPFDEIFKRATNRVKATTVTQNITNWIEDVVNKFLNVALSLPIGASLKAGAAKALAFAKDEPVNLKLLGATLERTFGDVLEQLGDVLDSPLSLPVALNAVWRINVNRCKNVLPSAETMWKSAVVAMNISTADWPPNANREIACPGIN